MYVRTTVTLTDLQGNEDDYEIGACVDYEPGGNGWAPCHSVSDPDFSAPNGELATSRLAGDPQAGDVFPAGWSDRVEERLIEEHEGRIGDREDDRDPEELRRDYYDLLDEVETDE